MDAVVIARHNKHLNARTIELAVGQLSKSDYFDVIVAAALTIAKF